uniref:FmsC n=1 Tax=Fusarium equiseti TaxID=61235 RepID=A0A2U7M7E2_FUSEQ|nr:FmsC [Fusarium equiseti]
MERLKMDSLNININDWFERDLPKTPDWKLFALASLAFVALRFTCTVIYRLYLSPLSKFPGPKIAAATHLYESYYDFWKKGQYYKVIQRMHEVYGPIVRVTPDELSINDPDFYDTVYVNGNVRRTESFGHSFGGGLGIEDTFFASQDHDLHRKRRKPIEPYFSRNGVLKLEQLINERVEKLFNKFHELSGTGVVARLDYAFEAFTGDVMQHICIEKPESLLNSDDFSSEWFEMLRNVSLSVPLMGMIPWLVHILKFIPERLIIWLAPEAAHFQNFRIQAGRQIEQAKQEKFDNDRKGVATVGGKPTLFRFLVHESGLAPEDLSTERLQKEAMVLLGGGTTTTARTATMTCFWMLSMPEKGQRLREELKDIMAEYPKKKPSLTELEKLPYLGAVIQESLRMAYGSMRRLPRTSPDQALQFKEWVIPPGTPVGMNAYYLHTDPNAFPEPMEYKPERWLGEVTPAMKRSFVPFSRGSRRCPGSSLALADLHFVLAALFGPTGPKFELFESDRSDVDAIHDYLMPLPRLDSKGVRVTVR